MSAELVTVFMIVVIAGFVGVDVYLAVDGKPGNTYSEIIRKAGAKWFPLVAIIIFAFGLLTGHWWW